MSQQNKEPALISTFYIGDALFGIVEIKADGFGIQMIAARRIGGEQLSQVPWLQLLSMATQRVPLRTLGQVDGSGLQRRSVHDRSH